jgi:phosphonate transport system substrate-binding protein
MSLLCLLAALPLFGGAPPGLIQDPETKTLNLSFGVYQTDKATEMYRLFTPLLEALQDDVAKRLARPVDIELRIFRSYDDGIRALVDGTVDLVHFGPASYIQAKSRQPNIRLLAMELENGDKRFKGVIVVAKNSPIQTIEDLRGKRFAFGDKNSTIGRYLVQAELVKHKVFAGDLSKFVYLERHDQVAAAVEHGDFDAGSVKISTFQKANDKGTLRKLVEFDNVTKPIVARAGLDDKTCTAIQQSLFTIADPALKALKISGFTSATDDDYQFVREGMKKAEAFDSAPPPPPARQVER